MNYLLGIDLGASDLKLQAICANSLKGIANVRHSIETHHPQANWSEQSPVDWELALIQAISELGQLINLEEIIAISITAGAHIPVLLAADNTVLRPAILWSDQRSAVQAERLAENPQFIAKAMNKPNATWTASMLLWLQENEPDIIQQCHTILPAKDYLRFLLTDNKHTDSSDAIGFLLAENLGKQWSEDLCQSIGLTSNLLPTIKDSTLIDGKITEKAAIRFGLPANIPVAIGAIDTSIELLGTIGAKAHATVIKIASAGVVFHTTDEPTPQPPVSLYPAVEKNHFYHASGMNSCATSLRWMTKILLDENTATTELFTLAENSEPGAKGIVALPYILGERAPIWSADVKAAFLGLTHIHDDADIAMAIIEATCFALKDVWQSMLQQITHNEDTPITIIGGGTHSKLWRETLAAVLNRQLVVLEYSDAAYGAALLAGVAINKVKLSEVDRLNNTLLTVIPDPEIVERYKKQWKRYKKAQKLIIDFSKT
jgi:xylulokinase